MTRPLHLFLVPALLALTLAACGDRANDGGAGRIDGVADEALPSPAGTPGEGVTGMPGARAAARGDEAVVEEAPEVTLDENGNPLPADALATDPNLPPPLPEEGPLPGSEAAPRPAGGEEAVALVRDYYSAINAGSFGRAYTLWADGGRASGPAPQQLADDFANTSGISAEIGVPGPVEPDSLQIEVPVTVTETLRDGGQRRLAGSYILRRSAAEAPWRIASSNLREAGP